MNKQIALITGASKGIGAATAIALAQDGFDIWLNYRSDHAAAEQIRENIIGIGSNCLLLPFDVCDREQVNQTLEPLLKSAAPYAVINNAGFAKDGLMMWMSDNDWDNVLDVHLGGFFNVTIDNFFFSCHGVSW